MHSLQQQLSTISETAIITIIKAGSLAPPLLATYRAELDRRWRTALLDELDYPATDGIEWITTEHHPFNVDPDDYDSIPF